MSIFRAAVIILPLILFFSIIGWAFVGVSFWFMSWSNRLQGELDGERGPGVPR